VIPSLGAASLGRCLDAVHRLEPPPRRVVVALSGPSPSAPPTRSPVELVRSERPLGFAAAVNLGFARAASGCERLAVLNDDALPPPDWLEVLDAALEADDRLAAVQGTITDADGDFVDGRGIELDRWGLPVQVDRGEPIREECDSVRRDALAVSGTAALLRADALAQASCGRMTPFDPAFGSYHEDLDLGLRLRRLGWRAAWVGGAAVRHIGSASGARMHWRHPWWLLANRWRAVAGNLTRRALVHELPRLLRGEVRAIRTLARSNPRAPVVAAGVAFAWPGLVAAAWRRSTPGQRLTALPDTP
jgi:GT2 family glycosyltransferase